MDGGAAAGGADRELAPAGADLEHAAAVGDAGLVEQPLDLAALRLGEVGVVEQRVRRRRSAPVGWRPGGHRRSRGPSRPTWTRCRRGRRNSSASRRGRARTGRWTGRSGARCWPGCWPRCSAGGCGRRGVTKARSVCSESGISVAIRAAGTVRKPAEVVGVPGAGQVGLAEADEAVAAEAGVELVGAVQAHGRPALAEATAGRAPRRRSRRGGRRRRGRVAWRRPRRRPCAGCGPAARGRACPGSAAPVGARPSGLGVGSVLLECHCTPSWRWRGRGRTGRRRAHSQMPCARISRLPRRAAPRVLRTGMSLRVPVRLALKRRRRRSRRRRAREGHGDVEPVGRDRHGDVVRAVDAVERGDVHRLVGAGPALLVGVDEVGVAVAVGVVHLDDDAGLAGRGRRSTRRR